MYNSKSKHNYPASSGTPHNALMKVMPFTTANPMSNIALGASPGDHRFQVPIQPDNVDLLMTAATALTSLTRPHGHTGGQQSSHEVLNALHGIPAAAMNPPPVVHTPLKRKGQRQKATRFPVKLMQVLSSGQYEHIISWTPDGLSFVVKKPSLLVSDVLPLYFKEVKYTSFTRKLHRWGFVKILRGKELSAYFHKSFRRGDFELCAQMHCSKTTQPIPKSGSAIPASKISATTTDSVSDAPAVTTNQPPVTTGPDNIGVSRTSEVGETEALDMHNHDMQLMELQRLRECESLSMPPLHNNQFYNISNRMMQTHPRQQLIMQGPQGPLSFVNEYGMNVVNTTPQFQDFEFARTRHSVEHQRIIANAWNVLSRERNKRAFYAQNGQGSDRALRSINMNYPPSA